MKTTRLLTTLVLLAAASAAAAQSAWVLTTDYSTFGRLRGFAPDAPWSVSADLATVPGDAVARHHDGRLYVVGRAGANVLQVYGESGTLEREFSLGAGRNPQDIAFDTAGDAYVSCYDTAELLKVDVAAEAVTAVYPTAPWADADGLPETAWMTAVGDMLYIAAQKLDRDNWYAPTGPGLLLVFDMATDTFAAPITLTGSDPYTRIEQVTTAGGGLLLRVGCAGWFGVADAGIESVDPQTGLSLGYDLTEAQLGGDVTAFVTTAPGVIHAVVSDASFRTHLVRGDTGGAPTTTLASATGYHFADVAWDGDAQLYLADRNPSAPGLRVFDAVSGAELTGGALGTGLPPFQIVLPSDDVSAAPLPALAGSLSLGAPFPNPCNPRAEVVLSGRPGDAVRVSVCDLRGRRLHAETVRLDAAGTRTWVFAGTDRSGRALPAGVYRLVAQGDDGFAVRSVTLVK
ncbi:hypothetical protein KDM41_17495 [bacterium]|nr:hypothetical protein [bacterium]